jgi:hypothetical protein
MLQSFIIFIAALSVFVLPFVIYGQTKKKKVKKLVTALESFAQEQGCQISRHETWNHSAIGLDDAKKVLFVYRNLNENPVRQFIPLHDVSRCKVEEASRQVKHNGGMLKVVDGISLVFSFLDNKKAPIAFSLYNAESDGLSLNGISTLAERWSANVQSLRSKK